MKNIFLLLLSAMLLSCSGDFLEKYPNTLITQSNFYKTEAQIALTVNDCYRQLNRLYSHSSVTDLYGELYSDNTWIKFMTGDDPYTELISQYRQLENSIPIRNAWNNAYNGIFICNNALYWIENGIVDYSTPAAKANFEGEVRAIRAIYYFNMVRAFGAVPMPLIPISSEESYSYLREDPATVYSQIISDLVYAKDNLAAKYSSASVGKITKYAAMGILAKVYLTLGDKEKARNELKAIVDSNLYSLDANADGTINPDDYTYLFAPATKNCKESILECQFQAGVNNPNSTHQHAYSPFLWAFHLPGSTSTYRGLGMNTPTQDLYDEFEDTDTVRRGLSVQLGFTDQDNGRWEDYPYTIKFADPANWQYSGSNFKALRFADILLLYAEVLGDADGAAYLNLVRRRAGLAGWGEPGYPLDKFPTFDLAVEHERRVELAMEYHRFFDLVRTGRAIAVINSKGFELAPEKLLFPIPIEAIDVNPGLTQNPGY